MHGRSKRYDASAVCAAYFFPQAARALRPSEHGGPLELELSGGARLGCYWSRPLEGAPTILYLHGNGESIADQLDRWPGWARSAGANIFFVDYPGYASSGGAPTFTSCCEAAGLALEHLLARPEREVPGVVVMGRSAGSVFALDAAARASSPRLRGLVLESGVADLKLRLDLRVPFAAAGLDREAIHAELDEDFSHQRKLGALRCPVLVLHSREDSLVPCWNGRQLAEWAGPNLHRLVLFEQGEHNDLQWVNQTEYLAALSELLALGR